MSKASSLSSDSSKDSDSSFFNNMKKKNNNKKQYYKKKGNYHGKIFTSNNRRNMTHNKINIPIISNSKKVLSINSSQKIKNYKPSNNKTTNNSPNMHYDLIQKFNGQRGRSSSIFTIKYSLLSLNIDLYTVMENNDNMLKLQTLIKSDEEFLSLIRNSSENQLLKYSDSISCIINDYKEIIKLGMRMKDFIRSSLLLVNSIISNDTTGVFIDNTCQILKCDRASLFLLDQVSDSLVIFSGEGLKRGQIKMPKNKGIVGACFMEKKKVRIDDAYTDQRFNKNIDIKTNYRTKSILCHPLVDNDGKCFGVIEAINKFNSPFNDDDEELLKLLSHQACIIFKNAFFNDNNRYYIKKIFSLMSYCNKMLHVKNKREFSEKTEDILLRLYNCMNSAFFFVENEKIVKYCKDSENKKEYDTNIGIIGNVYRKKEIIAYDNIKNSTEFNYIIDLESPSGLLAFPILSKKTKEVCAIIEVPFAGEINNTGKPKENEINLIQHLSKCIKNWIFEFNINNK
jgi:putative methionine-R-sulfoxide reductase with GAF domain